MTEPTKQNQHQIKLKVTDSDVPGSDVPGSDVPGSDVPGSDVPGSDVPGSDHPDSNDLVASSGDAAAKVDGADETAIEDTGINYTGINDTEINGAATKDTPTKGAATKDTSGKITAGKITAGIITAAAGQDTLAADRSQLSSNNLPASKPLLSMPLEEFLATLDASSPEQIESLLATERRVKLPVGLVRNFVKPFLAVPEGERTALNIVSWWESRRLVFNLIVGACGLPSLAILLLLHAMPFWLLAWGTIEYAIAANACYTLGWMAELITRACFAEKSRHMGPMLLTLGLVFSVVITLASALIIPLAFLGMALGI